MRVPSSKSSNLAIEYSDDQEENTKKHHDKCHEEVNLSRISDRRVLSPTHPELENSPGQ